MTKTTRFAAHDDLSIYAIGATADEAIQTARDAAQREDAQFEVSPIDAAFADVIETDGFDPMRDTFHTVDGVICAGRGY